MNVCKEIEMGRIVRRRRSVVKAITYRIVIMFLDFGTLYLLTGTVHVAIWSSQERSRDSVDSDQRSTW